MPSRHAITTCSDARYEGFLVDHWLASLRDNVTLTGVDVIVIDYGLTARCRARLQASGVVCHPGRRDGHPTNIRYRELAEILSRRSYDQVLCSDSGDIIFQADVSHLFERDGDAFRAVCEEKAAPIHEYLIPTHDFVPDAYAKIARFLRGRPVINGGFVLGPAAKMGRLWERFQPYCRGFGTYASDQLLVNYLLYKDGFKRLETGFNFVLTTATSPYSIREGVFCDASGGVIPVVHNAGMNHVVRRIRRFGYGRGRNVRKRVTPAVLKVAGTSLRWCRTLRATRA